LVFAVFSAAENAMVCHLIFGSLPVSLVVAMTNNNWPDPARSGVPLNPERDGWHWVADKDGIGKPWVEYWNGRDSWAPISATPNFICWHWRYIAPVLTPAEVGARVAQARRDALEEAAQRAAHYERMAYQHGHLPVDDPHECAAQVAREIETSIRALKVETND
jgi:hypothetical protein